MSGKTLENLATSLSDGGLAFQMQRLARGWPTCSVGFAVRYPEVPVVFAGSRRFAEELAYCFLGAAVADRIEST